MAFKSLVLRFLPQPLLRHLKILHYDRVIRKAAEEDEPDLLVVRAMLQFGDVAFDIGANIGIYTKFMSRYVGSDGRVVAIEPTELTFDILTRTVAQQCAGNVQLIRAAASDVDGELELEVPSFVTGGDNYYAARVVHGHDSSPRGPRFLVRSIRLDSLDAVFRDRVAFIKCDVEGHELACIRGASSLVRHSGPAWLIELSSSLDESGSSAAVIASLFAGVGFQVFWFDGMVLRRRRPGDYAVNYFFLGSHHVALLRRVGIAVMDDEP